MSEKERCIRCKNFQVKIMLNGYHGICYKHDCFCRYQDYCELFEKNETDHKQESNNE